MAINRFWVALIILTISILACGGGTNTPDFQATMATDVSVRLTQTAIAITNSTSISVESAPRETELPIPTLPPPLAHSDFPKQPITYPAEWPADIRYPEQFTVVELNSGNLPGSSTMGWATKLRYNGNTQGATDLLSSFFESKGWQIVEHINLDTGGIVFMIQRDNQGSGVVIIDIDIEDNNHSIILATVFP